MFFAAGSIDSWAGSFESSSEVGSLENFEKSTGYSLSRVYRAIYGMRREITACKLTLLSFFPPGSVADRIAKRSDREREFAQV